ncbi:MAG TPA: sugar-transfer associated ATP-grasp domain-containing protein [Ohtaekwangia sp.]|nr:sugar-transfer associated ATP-grasp domain-containing protein [Ohtaekwangia sp.]
MQRIKQIIFFFIVYLKLYRKDKKRNFKLSIRKQLYCWARGFLPESFVIYNFSENSHREYLSDYQRTGKSSLIYHSNSVVLDSKLIFHKYFKDTGRVIAPIFYCNNSIVTEFSTGRIVEKKEIVECLNAQSFVAKPSGGGGGFGILFISFKNGWYVNEKAVTLSELLDILFTLTDTLIFPIINQTGFAKSINPNSLNTIRFVTMVDPATNEVFSPVCVFRCGSKKSGAVDNWSNGGYSALIDFKSGRLGKAVSFPSNGVLEWISFHPDTKKSLEGFIIPNWDLIRDQVLALAKEHFYLPYIGWDIVPMEDGFIILEGNSNSDVNLLQVHGPLLRDERVRKFYKFYNVI